MGKMAWKILGDTRRRKCGRASRHEYHKGREFCMGLKEGVDGEVGIGRKVCIVGWLKRKGSLHLKRTKRNGVARQFRLHIGQKEKEAVFIDHLFMQNTDIISLHNSPFIILSTLGIKKWV